MTEEENKEFNLLQLADEMSHKNWMYFKFLYNKKFKEAEERIKALETALRDAYGDCLDAVNKIKTDALTDVAVHQRIAHTTTLTAKDFMVAMAEDIEREIKARTALGEKKDG